MKNKMKKMVALTLAASCLSVVGSTQSFAESTAKRTTVSVNELDTTYKFTMAKRNKKYNYVKAGLESVIPYGQREDTFTRVRVCIHKNENGEMTPISDEITLTEGCTDNRHLEKVYLNEDQMYVNYAYFGWIGNSPRFRAKARVWYDGLK